MQEFKKDANYSENTSKHSGGDISDIVFENQFKRELNNWNVKQEYKKYDLDTLHKLQGKRNYSVAAFNVEKGLNIGSMIRTSVCFQASEFILIGDRKYDKRSTVGAQNYIKITKRTESEFLSYLKSTHQYPVFFETNGERWSVPKFYENYVFEKTPCFIFGSESKGIPEEILNEEFDGKQIYSILHNGVLRSLNVSVAAGIVLNDYVNGE